MNLMSEKIINEVLNISKNFLKSFLDRLQWKTFFNDTVSFFTQNTNNDFINEQLNNLFTSSSINELTNIMKDNNGFTFKTAIESKLRKIIDVFDASNDEKNVFVSNFISCLLQYIKEKKANIYMEYITDEIYELVTYEKKLIEQNNEICSDIKEYVSSPRNVLSLYEVNNMLINSSSLKIDLSFFESDDKEFIEAFKDGLFYNQNINVVSSSREEALMTVLYELKKYEKNALVVYDYEDWMKIYSMNIANDLIYIPFFYHKMIPAIPNKKNIFIYDYVFTSNSPNKIVINRRNLNFVNRKLIEFQMDYSEVYKLLDNTHGFFVPMFKRLFDNAQIFSSYNISEQDAKAVISAILVDQWTDCEGDKVLISLISGMEYNDFISVINKYTIGNNPLIFKYNIYGEDKYAITSLEDSLIQFNYLIDDYMWKDYLDILEVVLFDVDAKYQDLSSENNMSFLAKSNFSNIIKEGIYKTLLYIMCCLGDTKKQIQIKKFFEKNLAKIETVNEWASISKYITYISEIVPEEFLDRLELEVANKENTGLKELFEIKNDLFFGENYYINYLWALEQLLTQKKYVYRSLDILFSLDEIKRDYKVTNSPKNTLKEVFCAWINMSCIENFEKVEILSKYIAKNPQNVIYALCNLPQKNQSIIGTLCKPKYRSVEINEVVTYKDINDIYIGYLDLCINFSKVNHEIIPELIDDIECYGSEIVSNFFIEICKLFELLNDDEKYQINYKLRSVIHKHRFYKNAEWSMPEKKLKIFIDALSEIVFSNEVYEYKYLFEKSYDFPLLNPIPYKSNEYSIVSDKNDRLVDEEVCEKIKDFNKKGLKLSDLIRIIDSPENNLGQYIHLFDHKYYLKETLHTIVNCQKNSRVLELYSWNIIRFDNENYFNLVNELITIAYDHKLLIDILRQYPIDDNYVTYLDELNFIDLKTGVWSSPLRLSSNLKSYEIIFDRIKQYGNEDTYLNTLYNLMDMMPINQVYDYLVDSLLFQGAISRRHEYELSTLLKELNSKFNIDDEKMEKLASVELKHWYILEWHQMIFLQKYVVKYSNIYSEILKYIYKNDDDEFDEKHKEYVSMMYKIYYKMEFCPGNVDGHVDAEIFEKWTEDFYNELVSQKQTKLFSSCMGKLCAYSPFGEDGMPLENCIREFVEKNSSKEFISAFITAEFNKRGVYTFSNGLEEHEIALKYKNYADYFRKNYPKCAYLFDLISDDYESQSKQEKVRAKYEQ